MLHNEARNLLVKAYEKSHNAREVAECFSVDRSTVYRLSKQMKETGSVDLQTSHRGRKLSLTDEDMKNIDHLVAEQSNIAIDEIIEQLILQEAGVELLYLPRTVRTLIQ